MSSGTGGRADLTPDSPPATRLAPLSERSGDRPSSRLLGLILGISLKDQAVFFRQLASMIQAGLTAISALNALQGQLRGRMRQMAAKLVAALDAGQTLSQAMARQPEYFSEFLVSMVRAGEVGGMLDVRLNEMATYLEESHQLQQALVSQMIYPAFILHAAILLPPIVVLVMQGLGRYLATVLPGLGALYLMALLLFLVSRLGAVLPAPRRALDRLVLALPLVGKVTRGASCMRFLRALGDLMEGGVSTTEAVVVAAHACGNAVLAQRWAALQGRLAQGGALTEALASTGLFSPASMQMIATGEQTGNLGEMMRKASDYLRIEHREAIHRSMVVLPIVLLLIMGVVIGYEYIQAFAGLFSQLNSLTGK